MKICFATKKDSENIINYFDKNLKKEDFWKDFKDDFYEYFCPFWVRRAIKRNEIILFKNKENIIWALRFYPRKNSKIASLYQFAFDESIKNRKIFPKILEFISFNEFQTQCFKNSKLNNYLEKQGFEIIKSDEKINYFRLKI